MTIETELWSAPLAVRVWGERACFTMPATRAEPFTFPVMTPSAAQGVIQSIFWKPEIEYRIERISLLKPVRMSTVRMNGVRDRPSHLDRTNMTKVLQRNVTILRDVDYVIEFAMRIKDAGRTPFGISKYIDQFNRRVKEGRCFRDPCLGMREFIAGFEKVHATTPRPIALDRHVGMMPHTRIWGRPQTPGLPQSARPLRTTFFDARIVDGVMHVPHEGVAA